jgi:hypothetical protein
MSDTFIHGFDCEDLFQLQHVRTSRTGNCQWPVNCPVDVTPERMLLKSSNKAVGQYVLIDRSSAGTEMHR